MPGQALDRRPVHLSALRIEEGERRRVPVKRAKNAWHLDVGVAAAHVGVGMLRADLAQVLGAALVALDQEAAAERRGEVEAEPRRAGVVLAGARVEAVP